MSYCVNCGVELEQGVKQCALCGTKVINPNDFSIESDKQIHAFSENDYTPSETKKRFIAYVVSMFILIPNIVCSLANAVFFNSSFWSFYINATSILIWTVVVFPFFTKKIRPYLMWAFDTIAACAYVFFFFVMGYETDKGWYYNIALPIILSSAILILIFMIWVRKKTRHWVLKVAHIVSDIAIESMVIGTVLDINCGYFRGIEVGLIVFISCLVIIAFLIYCYSSEHMRKWLSKKFFV